jgi:hypothetical protein
MIHSPASVATALMITFTRSNHGLGERGADADFTAGPFLSGGPGTSPQAGWTALTGLAIADHAFRSVRHIRGNLE